MDLVFLIELLFDRRELTPFELSDLDRFPSLGGADERAEHQLQDRSLAECCTNKIALRYGSDLVAQLPDKLPPCR